MSNIYRWQFYYGDENIYITAKDVLDSRNKIKILVSCIYNSLTYPDEVYVWNNKANFGYIYENSLLR